MQKINRNNFVSFEIRSSTNRRDFDLLRATNQVLTLKPRWPPEGNASRSHRKTSHLIPLLLYLQFYVLNNKTQFAVAKSKRGRRSI